MLVGALNRESALFLGPLAYAVWAQRPFDRAALARTLAVAAPALAAFVALRLAIPTVGREQVPGYDGSLLGQRLAVAGDRLRGWRVEARRLLAIYGRCGCSRRRRCATSPSRAAASCWRRCARSR
jgi:hypothetical protein